MLQAWRLKLSFIHTFHKKGLSHRLQQQGINVIFNQASTGHVSGISYELKGFRTTGAALGANFKWAPVRARIDYDQQRDRSSVQAANARKQEGQLQVQENQSSISQVSTTSDNIPLLVIDLLEPERVPEYEMSLGNFRKKHKRKRRKKSNR